MEKFTPFSYKSLVFYMSFLPYRLKYIYKVVDRLNKRSFWQTHVQLEVLSKQGNWSLMESIVLETKESRILETRRKSSMSFWVSAYWDKRDLQMQIGCCIDSYEKIAASDSSINSFLLSSMSLPFLHRAKQINDFFLQHRNSKFRKWEKNKLSHMNREELILQKEKGKKLEHTWK